MPSESKAFPWISHLGKYDFFEKCMRNHNKVVNIRQIEDALYELDHIDRYPLRVFVCDCYSFGVAEYLESENALGPLNVVIINSLWCSYTMDAKMYCRTHRVGLFNISGFMSALNRKRYWEYLTKEEKEHFEKSE